MRLLFYKRRSGGCEPLRRNQGLWPFPAGPFLLVIIVVCIGIAISGAYGYYTLSQFRDKYLEKLGHDIATQIDAKTRGPGNRTNLSLWGESLEDSLRSHAREVAYILLYDLNGQTVARASSSQRALSAGVSGG
jgi:hypothetical protein